MRNEEWLPHVTLVTPSIYGPDCTIPPVFIFACEIVRKTNFITLCYLLYLLGKNSAKRFLFDISSLSAIITFYRCNQSFGSEFFSLPLHLELWVRISQMKWFSEESGARILPFYIKWWIQEELLIAFGIQGTGDKKIKINKREASWYFKF